MQECHTAITINARINELVTNIQMCLMFHIPAQLTT